MILESCCETIEQAIRAEKNGAGRIEFCSSLDQEGLTPKVDEVATLLTLVSVPVRVMIRPFNDFHASEKCIRLCKAAIKGFEKLPLDGYVFGYLTADGEIDLSTSALLLGESPKPFTFHKAIDRSKDIIESLRMLDKFSSIDTVLSSGGFKTAMEGANILREMQEKSLKTIMAGGSITSKNLHNHHKIMQLQAYHGTKIV